jgi:hypothetical protein
MARITRSTVALLVAALVASAVLPTVASAQHGNGLYEPFPKADARKRAKRFVERLPLPPAVKVRLGDEQLARGVFLDPPRPAPPGPGPASARAGLGDGDNGGSSVSPLTQIALLLLAVVALPVVAGRRPRGRVAAA